MLNGCFMSHQHTMILPHAVQKQSSQGNLWDVTHANWSLTGVRQVHELPMLAINRWSQSAVFLWHTIWPVQSGQEQLLFDVHLSTHGRLAVTSIVQVNGGGEVVSSSPRHWPSWTHVLWGQTVAPGLYNIMCDLHAVVMSLLHLFLSSANSVTSSAQILKAHSDL